MTAVLVGAYTRGAGGTARGVALAVPDADGRLRTLGTIADAVAPSWLLPHAGGLLAVDEHSSRIVAWRMSGGRLERAGDVPVAGDGPCHLAFAGDLVAASCYGSGSVSLHELRGDGSLGESVGRLDGAGSGPHEDQAHARAHAVLALADGRILVADLGADEVVVLGRVGGAVERLGSVRFAPGTGPRDLSALPDGRVLLLGQIDSTLHLLDPGAAGAIPSVIASTRLSGALPGTHAAGIAVDAERGLVHVGLRGADRVATARIAGDELSSVGDVPCGGAWPRHLAIIDGVLHVANERSNAIASFRVDDDGVPRALGEPLPAASPTHLVAAPGEVWSALETW